MNQSLQNNAIKQVLLIGVLLLNSWIAFGQQPQISNLPPEDCFNGLDDDGDGYVDCYDIDCQCETPPACSFTIPPITDITIQSDWQSESTLLNNGAISGIPIVGNLNPQTDSIPEILATRNFTGQGSWDIKFFRGDGSNANNADSLELVTGVSGLTDPVIGDVDGDGIPELVVAEWDFYLRVYRNFTPGANPVMTHWITSTHKIQHGESRPMLADLDGDGISEVVIENEVFIFDFSDPSNAKLRKVLDAGNNNPSGKQYFSLNYNPIWLLASPAIADLLTPQDCNGDPDCNGLEIAAGPVIYSIDLDTLDGDGFQIKIQRDLNFLESPDVFGDGYTAIADMNIDGIPDVVVMGRGKVGLDPAQLGVYVWNKNGLLRYMNIPIQDSIWGRYSCMPMIANVFDDTKRGLAKDFPEVVFSTANNLYAYNLHATNFPDISAWWFLPLANLSFFPEASATAFDFNGDAISEIVFSDQSALRIVYGGHFPFPPGVDANRNWATFPLSNATGGLADYPTIADVDNDGQAEIVESTSVGSDPLIGTPIISVFESATLPWPPCRNLWNQFNYNIVNVDDDLGIPVQQQPNWLEFPAPGSGKRPLNMALGQRGPLNGAVLIPLPDLASAVDTFYCDQDSLKLRLRVCNNGSTAAPAGLSLQWYQGDPTTAPANPYSAPYIFPSTIVKDSCRFWDLALPLPPNGTIYGIINDNGSISGPIDLATDFPSTNLIECDYLDNLFSFNVSYTTPTLDLGPDQSVCKDASVTLNANPGFSRYRWQDGSPGAAFNATGIGTYWVDAWDICGNLFSDTLRLLAIPAPILALGPDDSVCVGNSITLEAPGFDQVDWSTAGSIVCADCPNYTFNPATDLSIQVAAQSGICVERDTIFIQVSPLPQISGQAIETHCGNSDGSINLLINSALPYQLEWSSGQTSAMVSGLAAASYTVTVTDDAGCTQTETFAVAGSTAVVLAPAVLTDLRCFGDQSGSISVSLISGTTPYQFNWSTGPGSDVLQNLAAGNYDLTVTDALGCTGTSSYLLMEAPELILQSTIDGTSCLSTTADISLLAQGGTAPYNFNWATGQNTPNLNDLPPGTYTVSLVDANGCETTQVFDIQIGGSPQISNVLLSPPLCFGDNTGTITVEVSLGAAPYQYNWSSGPGTNVLQNLAAGNYDLTITDAAGCTSSAQYSLSEPSLLDLQSTLDPTTCSSITADISVIGLGGTSPYQYHWSSGQNTPDLVDIQPGAYVLTLSDANGCETIQSFDIQIGGSPVISDSILVPVYCFGENSGEISVTVSLGLAPYQFNWSTGPGTATLSNLSAGQYALTSTDANGCSTTAQFVIVEPNAISIFADIDSTSCTSSTGDISITVLGGITPFAYFWNDGQNTPVVNNLNPGTYTVTISDENSCTTVQSFTLAPGGAPVVASSEVIPVSCTGETNGQITVDVNGGVPPYQLQWSTGAIASIVGNLPAGDYSFTATGANGCITSVQFTVTEPPLLLLDAMIDSTSCTSITGNISLSPQGGTAPFTYLWNDGQVTAVLSNLTPGDYSITTTDSNGCTTSGVYTILPGGSPELASSTVTPVTCFGDSNGGISVQTTGGGMPYQYNWSSGQGAEVLSNLPAGPYQLTIIDANGCTVLADFTVESPAAIDATLTALADTCAQSTGSITVNSSGGIAPYTYLWSDGSTNESLFDLSEGLFQLTITDANACTFTQDAAILPVEILPQFSVTGDTLTCIKTSVALMPDPAPANWMFQWQTPDGALLSGANQTVSEAGPYSVAVTNELGCEVIQLLDIAIDTLHPQAVVAANNLFIPCGQTMALLDGSGSSAGPFFTAHWIQENNGQIVWDTLAQQAQTSSAGTFILEITNLENGCTDKETVQVTVAERISDVELELNSISCFGQADGVIQVISVMGGMAPYSYALDNQAFSTDFSFTGLSEGDYVVKVLDANGCDWQSAPLTILEPAPLSLNLTASDTRVDQGDAVVLQAQVQPTGTTLSQIQWSPQAYFSLPVSLTETVQLLETTLFQLEIEDPNGCSASDTIRVQVRRDAVYVPNIFHPGSQDNHQFTVYGAADIQEVTLMQVYDRWGELLFEKRHFPPNDPSQGWDGSYRGQAMPPGVYIYYLELVTIEGRALELKGNVTVLR